MRALQSSCGAVDASLALIKGRRGAAPGGERRAGAPCSALTSRSSPGAVPAGGTSASEHGPALGPVGAGGDAGMPGVVCPRQGGARVQLGLHGACAPAPPHTS